MAERRKGVEEELPTVNLKFVDNLHLLAEDEEESIELTPAQADLLNFYLNNQGKTFPTLEIAYTTGVGIEEVVDFFGKPVTAVRTYRVKAGTDFINKKVKTPDGKPLVSKDKVDRRNRWGILDYQVQFEGAGERT